MLSTARILISQDIAFPFLSLHIDLLILSIVSIISLAVFLYISSFLRLRHVPGPLWAAHSRLWLARLIAHGEAANRYVEINRKYGMPRLFPVIIITIKAEVDSVAGDDH